MTTKLNTSQAQAINQFSKTIYYGGMAKIIQLVPAELAKANGLTKKAFGEAAYEIIQKRLEREKRKRPVVTVGRWMWSRAESRLTRRFEASFAYRQPESDWVDVNNTVRVILSPTDTIRVRNEWGVYTQQEIPLVKSYLEVRQDTVWHPKKSWKANETTHTLYLRPSDDFTMVGGLLTIFRKADRNKAAIPCYWYEQSRGFDVREVSGWLVGDYHIEADSEEKAIALATRRKKQADKERKRLDDLKEQRDSAQLTAAFVARTYGFCMAGIRSFCEANGLDPKGTYTLKELRNVVVANRDMNCRAYWSYLNRMGLNLNCK